MSGYISPPFRAKLLTKAELRATIAGLEERNMSTVGEPQQLTVRLAREMLKEIEHDEKILKRSQRGSDKKRTKLFKQLTQKFGLQIWKNLGTGDSARYVETYTNPNLSPRRKRRSPKVKSRSYSNASKNAGDVSKQPSSAIVSLTSSPRISEYPCALCEKLFVKENLTGTVTLRAVWRKRESFPLNLNMPKVLKNNWTKLYSEVNVCVFCAQMFQILKEEKRVPFPRPKKNSFKFTSTQHVLERHCAFGSSAIQRPGLFGPPNNDDDIDKKSNVKKEKSQNRPDDIAGVSQRPFSASPSASNRKLHVSKLNDTSSTPCRPKSSSRIRRNSNNSNIRGFGISSPRLTLHKPREQSLKSFMAERHPPSFNPFKKDNQVPVENTVNQRATTKKMRNGRKNRKNKIRRKKRTGKKSKDRDWSMFGEFQF